MRPPVQPPAGAPATAARGPAPVAPKPPPDGGPLPPLVPKPPAAPPRTPGVQGAEQGGAAAAGGMMGGSWGGGISPGSLEGVSTLRLCLYGMGMMIVMFLLFGIYVYAMIGDDDGTRAVPPGHYFPGDGNEV